MYTPELFRRNYLSDNKSLSDKRLKETPTPFMKEFCGKLTPRLKNNSVGVDFSDFIDSKTQYDCLEDDVTGLIIESRNHPLLEEVIIEFHHRLSIPIQVFHGPASKSRLLNGKLKSLIKKGTVRLTALKTNRLAAKSYNALLLSNEFWRQLIGRKKILIFQTDAILCESSDYKLENFLNFDYIGSKWPNDRVIGVRVEGGNGGLSIRDWEASTRVLKMFPSKYWSGAEDTYFAFFLKVAGYNVANNNDCSKFSTQYEFLRNSFGAHKISLLKADVREEFLKYCPQAKRLLNS